MILRAAPGSVWVAILLAALFGTIALARAGSALFFSTHTVDIPAPGRPALPVDQSPGSNRTRPARLAS